MVFIIALKSLIVSLTLTIISAFLFSNGFQKSAGVIFLFVVIVNIPFPSFQLYKEKEDEQ